MQDARTHATLSDLSELAGRVGQVYAARFDIERDAAFYLGKLSEELGEVSAAYLKLAGQARTQGRPPEELRADLQDELADLFGFLLLFSEWQGVDLGTALIRKWGAYLEPADDA